VVAGVKTLPEAFEYLMELCRQKEAVRGRKVIAAPGLETGQFSRLETLCRDRGFTLIERGLRDHLEGIDIGFTIADYGIAETGTLVLNSSSEEVRLATMISEIHVAVLAVSRIRETSYDLESELKRFMQSPADYTAFITGASRTADIERVLALGVHGPLELHILLLEDS